MTYRGQEKQQQRDRQEPQPREEEAVNTKMKQANRES